MSVPFDTLRCAKRLEAAGFTWEQAVALTEGLVKAAAARSSAEDGKAESDLSACHTPTLRKTILTFDDWLFIAAFAFLALAVSLPD